MEYKLPGNVKIESVNNPSLLFDKCFSAENYKSDKIKIIKDIARDLTSNYKFGNLDVYTAYKNRMESVAAGFESQGYMVKTFMLKSISGLCIGMGRDSAIENGITLEKNLGIPIIPSSSIKGVVRSYVTLYGSKADIEKIDVYFGSDDDQNPKAGEVDFLDAYMINGSNAYKVDIINNHFSDYYQKEDVPPNDWFNPIPVYFLTVSEGKTFEFTILGKDEKIIADVQNLIEKAFKEIGVGGKTSVGYGRFEIDSQAMAEKQKILEEKKKAEERKVLDSMSPFDKKIYILENSTDNDEKERIATELYNNFDSLEKEEQLKCAKALKASWESMGKWSGKDISKKQKAKVEKIKKFLDQQK